MNVKRPPVQEQRKMNFHHWCIFAWCGKKDLRNSFYIMQHAQLATSVSPIYICSKVANPIIVIFVILEQNVQRR